MIDVRDFKLLKPSSFEEAKIDIVSSIVLTIILTILINLIL